jgi:hypothetical protein
MDKKIPIFVAIIVVIVIFSFLAIRYTMDVSAISKIQVTVKNVQIQEIKLTYTKLKLDIEISNPTNEYIYHLSTDYNIFIADNIVGNGKVPLTNIPARSTNETSTNPIIYYINVTNAVIDAIVNQNFNLAIKGTLNVKVFFGLIFISQDYSATYYYS